MSKKEKKNKKKKCGCTNQISNPILSPDALPKIKMIPIRDIPDNCQLICIGPFCTLACFGEGLQVIHCDIVCDDAGNCTVVCHDEND